MDRKVVTLVKTLRNLFLQMGMPVELATDGGPSFKVSEFSQFCRQ